MSSNLIPASAGVLEPGASDDNPSVIGRGRYELRHLLGRGSSGEIYSALDRRSGEEVAVKILRTPHPEEIYHLKREFRALADVDHQCLVRLHELHVEEERWFFSMDRVDGVGLLEFVESGDRTGAVLSILPQLVSALSAVHALGIVHRDLKPENILVERREDGSAHLVLIDFGLLSPLLPDARDTAALASLTGTIAYMAPEQLRGVRLSEAADWYGVGAVIFHAIFGRLPFGGSAVNIVTAKMSGMEPSIPTTTPTWLGELIAEMLANDPARRPSGQRISDLLHSNLGDRSVSVQVAPARHFGGWRTDATQSASFVGRDSELASLGEAFEQSRLGHLSIIRVRGPSGIGKSGLIEHFLAGIERDSDAVVLRGRCHPSEAIPRKGLDQIVDDLSRYLQIEDGACEGFSPLDAAALCRLFPVLGRVQRLTTAASPAVAADPQIVRQLGIDTFAALLATIGSSKPLVLWIDDVQWSDTESAIVLSRFLADVRARGLVILSYRSEAETIAALLIDENVRDAPQLEVPPLDAAAARRLVQRMWEHEGGSVPIEVDAIVEEAAGSPFFLAELVRSIRSSARSTGAHVPRVGDVVAFRYGNLPASSRKVMDVIALAGAPLREETSVAAAGGPEAWRSLSELERACLIRSIDMPEGRRVQPYHDRIADGVRTQLGETQRNDLHRALILELEREADPDHELLVFHCSEARQMARAAHHAVPAARRSADRLDFDRAAELYRFALEHGVHEQAEPLRIGLAESLANAGRGEEAAMAFSEAARAHPGRALNDPAAIDLQRRGAEQLLRCGRIDEGFASMREALACFGERLPATSGEAMRSFLWQRVRLLARGTKVRPGERTLDATTAARLDAMWSTTIAVSMVDVGLAGSVQVRHFLDSLRTADPHRLSLALALEATWRSCLGSRIRRSAPNAIAESRRLAAVNPHPYPHAWAWMAEGIVHWQSAQFAEAVPCLDRALATYRQGCRGVFFEVALTTLYQFAALALSGRIARLSEIVEAASEDARRRRDRFAHHGCFMGEAVQARLAADEPDVAIADADLALAEWPQRSFLMPHYQHLLATVQADLYRGNADSARQRLDASWSSLRKTGYLWLECPSLTLRFLRARAALGILAARPDAADREALLRVARGEERLIRRSGLSLAAGYAATIRAGMKHATGDRDAAWLEVHKAFAVYREANMMMHAAACDQALARIADAPQVSDRSVAEDWGRTEGWKDLDRLANSIVPLPRA